jgi:glyoxylase-like metal-dependent hydrolase (beta-lactamase superfamily II)
MNRLGWIAGLAALGIIGLTEGASTQAAWAWKPAIQTAGDGQVHVQPVRDSIYLLVGAGGNITVSAGDDGILMVDGGTAAMSDKVLAAVRTISNGPIRYLINTNEREEYSGSNEKIAAAGETIPFRPNETIQIQGYIGTNRATVISYVSVYERMSAPTGKVAPRAEAAWPDATYSTPQKKLYFNGEPVLIMHQPSATDGNSLVHFRRSDIISVGDLIDLTTYPFIDLNAGGSIQATLQGLNRLIDITVPEKQSEDGTLVIPGHGRIADQPDVVYYYEMLSIIRDRVRDMISRGLTLPQVHAARPTRDFDNRYSRNTGAWTTERFVEAVYQSLKKF